MPKLTESAQELKLRKNLFVELRPQKVTDPCVKMEPMSLFKIFEFKFFNLQKEKEQTNKKTLISTDTL